MFIDTHCHLTTIEFKDNIPSVITSASGERVEKIIVMGTDLQSSRDVVSLTERYKSVYGAAGLHPEEALDLEKEEISSVIEDLRPLYENEKIVAVGEIGLDIRWIIYLERQPGLRHTMAEAIDMQKIAFRKQLELAVELSIPSIIHCRESEKEMFPLLDKFISNGGRGVLHSFTGNADFMNYFVEKGMYVSFNGIITFKNGQDVRNLLSQVPMDRLLFETDAPFLAPEPYRGQLCEPKHVVEIYKKASEIKNVSLIELEDVVEENVKTLFKIG